MQCQEDSSIQPSHEAQYSPRLGGTLETDDEGVKPSSNKHESSSSEDIEENIPDPSAIVRRRILSFMIGICAVVIFTLVQAGNQSRTIRFESPNDREPTFPIDERPRDPFSEIPMDKGSFSNNIGLVVNKNLSVWRGSYNGEVFLDENWKPGDWTLSISKEGGITLNNVHLIDYTYIAENSTLSWKSQYCGPFQTSWCDGSIEFDALITFNKTNGSNETLSGTLRSNNATESFFHGHAGLFECRGFSAIVP